MRQGLLYRLRHSALAMAALFAALFQGAVVQAHVHLAPANHHLEQAQPLGDTVPLERAAHVGGHACSHCQALSSASLAALGAPEVPRPAAASEAEAAAEGAPPHVRQVRRWQSRAPPTRL